MSDETYLPPSFGEDSVHETPTNLFSSGIINTIQTVNIPPGSGVVNLTQIIPISSGSVSFIISSGSGVVSATQTITRSFGSGAGIIPQTVTNPFVSGRGTPSQTTENPFRPTPVDDDAPRTPNGGLTNGHSRESDEEANEDEDTDENEDSDEEDPYNLSDGEQNNGAYFDAVGLEADLDEA
ncbi:hypothetical protein PITC_099140 [Penicillium italicum]|uniref:Uncharacterized protein n=1 Tax=Penicillium italicum TaxID=40296 RepID=A0A0A2L363_PENIT|nr:hypothetical protein PITC_099140 [Penicillium italicum]